MSFRLRTLLAPLAVALILYPASGFSQGVAPVEVPAARKQAAEALVTEAVRLSRVKDVFQDARQTLTSVTIPVFRDALQGNLVGTPAPDPKTAAVMAKVLTFVTYAQKAGDDLDGAIRDNESAMIADAASIIAEDSTDDEIAEAQKALQLPAVRKAFEVFYTATRLVTGFSYEDTRTLSEFSAWAKQLDVDFSKGLPGAQSSPPPQRRLAKAQALVTDLVRISRMDDLVAEALRFTREVYLEAAPLPKDEKGDIAAQADQLEFAYNFQKSIMIAAAPAVIAASLGDDDIAIIHTFVRSPAFARLADLVQTLVKTTTSLTVEEIRSAQSAFAAMESKKSGPEADQRSAERWSAFGEKWSKILKSRIAPETLAGLEASGREIQLPQLPESPR